MSKYVVILFLYCSSVAWCQNNDEKQIRITINQFFEGLQKGDSLIVKETLTKGFFLQSVSIDSLNHALLHNINRQLFFKVIESKDKRDVWNEKLGDLSFNINGDLAQVMMSFTFYLNNKRTHCGVNAFQLVKLKGHWKISSVTDTRRKSCQDF